MHPGKMATPLIRDFFGEKMGRSVGRFTGMLSPVSLHRNHQQGISTATQNVGFKSQMANFASAWKKSGYGVDDYFSGRRMHYGQGSSSMMRISGPSDRNANIRMGAAATVGAWGASRFMMGGENPVSQTAGGAMQIGAHAGITAAIGRRSPMAAAAYAGVAGVNALRPGSNWGPF